MNRNSNVYTVIYATVLTVLVAILLSAASLGLKDKQKANTDNEKKQQILQSVASKLGKEVTFENAADLWQELKMDDAMFCVNTKGEKVDGKAFDIASKSLFSAGKIIPEATLPVYVANINGVPYRIMSMYGAGLWGPIWGYLSVDPEGKVAGVSFDHDSETAGLGSKIKDDPAFANAFIGKSIFTDDKFTSVSVTSWLLSLSCAVSAVFVGSWLCFAFSLPQEQREKQRIAVNNVTIVLFIIFQYLTFF